MVQRRSRLARLRAPFVVTAAMGVSACGGVAAREDPKEGPNTTEPVPETRDCPRMQIFDGTPCNYVGDSCQLGTNGCPATFAACREHHWLISVVTTGGCNPPPPSCPAGPCPTEPPVDGAPCGIAATTVCSRLSTCSEPGYEAQCFLPGGFPTTCAGTWRVNQFFMACNPPPPWFSDGGLVDAAPPHSIQDAGPARD